MGIPCVSLDFIAEHLSEVRCNDDENDIDAYIARGIPCVSLDFIAEHLFEVR